MRSLRGECGCKEESLPEPPFLFSDSRIWPKLLILKDKERDFPDPVQWLTHPTGVPEVSIPN